MINKYLPYFIFKPLFGDRKQFGLQIDETDPDYRLWKENYLQFYNDNQKGKIGSIVNRFGFSIIKSIDFQNKTVLELGPGIIEHTCFFSSIPHTYYLADIDPQFLQYSQKILQENQFKNVKSILMSSNKVDIPLESNSVDIVLSFHQLEHVFQLENHIAQIKRVLKPNGILAGSVPTEGSFAWGLGRFLTSRPYVKKHMTFNYDKVICWEHPNFVDKIKSQLAKQFKIQKFIKKPFPFLPIDFNLSLSFICRKQSL